MDETIFRKPVLQKAVHNLGLGEKWDALDQLYEVRQIGLRARLESHYKLLQGMRINDILHEVEKVEVMKNIRETVERLKGFRVKLILLTDLPDFVCTYLMERFGFEGFVASKIGQKDGIVIGSSEVLDDKALGLRTYVSYLSVPLSRCIHIGDGMNDVPVFREVGHSVALNSKTEAVRKSASRPIDTDDMLDVCTYLSTIP